MIKIGKIRGNTVFSGTARHAKWDSRHPTYRVGEKILAIYRTSLRDPASDILVQNAPPTTQKTRRVQTGRKRKVEREKGV